MEKKRIIKKYATPQECIEALKGMLEIKQQWQEYADKREAELSIS